MKKAFKLLKRVINGCIWYFTPHTEEPLEPLPGCLCGGCTDFYFVCTACREKNVIGIAAPCQSEQINGRYYCLDCAKESLMKRQTLEEILKRTR
jgi:hypothetical protein